MVFEKWEYRHISRSPSTIVIFEIASVKPVIVLYILSYCCYDNRQLRVHTLVICLVKYCGQVSCVLPLALMQQPDFHLTDFSKISFWELFLKFVKSWQKQKTMLHTFARTPLDKGSARRRNICQTAHNIHKRQRSMHLAGFILHIPSKRAIIDKT
jgi:hypothetical protein